MHRQYFSLGIFVHALQLAVLLCLNSCAIYPGRVPQIVDAPAAIRETVETADGPLVGVSAPQGRAFLGVPYALPPIEDLRWMPPQPLKAHIRPLEATHTGPPCAQAISSKILSGGGGGFVIGNEDCLYLNIYLPPASMPRPAHGWPVMTFIPGGAFVLGSGDNYDPSKLARSQGVAVVTINYRLGAFGFFAHPALRREGSGNFGLLDQQAALRWVHDNIATFGGNQGNVTLFGESAGAWSACYQMLSPNAVGLFQRVILESGSCTDQQSMVAVSEAEKAGPTFAKSLGCPDPNVLECLRSLSTRRIAQARATRAGVIGPNSWGPAWGDSVIPLKPPMAFRTGHYRAVPAIVGSNQNEGRLFAFSIRSEQAYDAALQREFGEDAARVKAQYPVNEYGSPRLAYAAIVTDNRFACPADDLRHLWAGRAPIYGYEFADPMPPFRLPEFLMGGAMGSYHASELAYVFGTSWALANTKRFTPGQQGLSDQIMGAWGRFARGKRPIDGWKTFSGRTPSVLKLHPQLVAASTDFYARHACRFWHSFHYRPRDVPHGAPRNGYRTRT